ncbi:MAG: peptidoglycan DD-metalloendopeptidase family protein [Bacillota bacterium]
MSNNQDNDRDQNKFPFSISKDKEKIKLKLKKNIDRLADKFSWQKFFRRVLTSKKFLVSWTVIILIGIILIPQLHDSTSQHNSSVPDKQLNNEQLSTTEDSQELNLNSDDQSTTLTITEEEISQSDNEAVSKSQEESATSREVANYQPNFSAPLESGQLAREYGWSKHPVLEDWRYHQGVDLVTTATAPIRAAASGQVVEIKEDDYLGLVLLVEHNKSYRTLYGHASKFYLTEGDQVKQGQAIGEVGTSGLVMKPTLHFELRKNDEIVNPQEYLEL